MKTITKISLAVLVIVSLAGCVVVPYGYGHGPYHPCGYHRCR